MYPMPEQFKVNTWELITGTVKAAFEIFNEVKGMLPEGAMKNIKIPGLPDNIQGKVGDAVKVFNQGKELFEQFSGPSKEDEFEDFEDLFEEDLAEMKFIGGETKAQFQERVDDRNRYVAMCNKEK